MEGDIEEAEEGVCKLETAAASSIRRARSCSASFTRSMSISNISAFLTFKSSLLFFTTSDDDDVAPLSLLLMLALRK